MLLQFGNDFCAACEPIARIWQEGNDPIEHRPTAEIALVAHAVDLQEIQHHELGSFSKHDTHSVKCVVSYEMCVASYEVASALKKVLSTHVEIPKVERFRMREGKKGERLKARRPPTICATS